jgi:hypothetical protein
MARSAAGESPRRRGALEHRKNLQQRPRLLFEKLEIGGLDHAVAQHIAPVFHVLEPDDGLRHGHRLRPEPPLDIEQHDLVDLLDGFRRPVVALHQTFASPLGRRGRKAEHLGNGRLLVEHQTVFAPSGQHMQVRADAFDHGLVALNLAHGIDMDDSMRRQFLPAAPQTAGLRRPRARPADRARPPGLSLQLGSSA